VRTIMKGRAALAVLLAVLVFAACGDSDEAPTEIQLPPLGERDSIGGFTFGGLERNYVLHVPPNHDPQVPEPLLLFFHGFSSSGREFQFFTGLDAVTDERGWVTVYPDGVSGSWAAECDCTTADDLGVDDVAFVDALIEELGKTVTVDESRIYAAGFSQGSQFVHLLACVRANRLAAVASVGATLATVVADRCQPVLPLPIVFIQGTDDQSFPWGGLPPFLSLNETVGKWVDLDGCQDFIEDLEPDLDPDDGTLVRTETYSSCDGGSEVKLYSVERGGHTWPSSVVPLSEERFGLTNYDISASRVIVDFFSRFMRD